MCQLPSRMTQTQIKLFAEIMRFCTSLSDTRATAPTQAQVDKEVEKALGEMDDKPTPSIPDPIVVMLTTPQGIKSIKTCRGVLGNYLVFKKYADPALGYPASHVTWNHWTSVRSALMHQKYKREGISCGVHRGMRVLIFPLASELTNLAVSESECYRIMC